MSAASTIKRSGQSRPLESSCPGAKLQVLEPVDMCRTGDNGFGALSYAAHAALKLYLFSHAQPMPVPKR